MTHSWYAGALLMLYACMSALAQNAAPPLLKASKQLVTTNPQPPSDAQAVAGPIGHVKKVQGQATVVTDGKAIKALLGTTVLQGSLLKTGADGSLGVTFNDGTMMSIGPLTELTVDDYLYAPAIGELRLGARLTRGTLNYVSGVIAKLKPENVSLRTPSGLIGVRGTHFVAKVDPDGTESVDQ